MEKNKRLQKNERIQRDKGIQRDISADFMDNSDTKQEDIRVALMGIIVEDTEAAARINGLLHEYGNYIVGRMGLPYRERNLNIISIILDAPQSVVSALSGKLGMIPGVNSKCLYAKK